MWCKQLEACFLGFEVGDFHAYCHESGYAVDVDDVWEWLDDDGGNLGYRFLSDTKMAAAAPGYIAQEDNGHGQL